MDEINWLYRAGVTPLGIILAATRDAAYVCRLDGLLGTLELGKVADVLVVRGDPLANLGALNKVIMVMHGGTVIRD
jgi:imidazolonepropionase-like amidohydrolase